MRTPTVFPVINAPQLYLIIKLSGAEFIGGRCLKEEGAYRKERQIINSKSQNFVIFFLKMAKITTVS